MPNYTENLQLEKPLQSEQYNVDVFNANADKIDQFAGQIPARALTADKLTTGAKINGVNFKGDTNVITGLGLHSSTDVYAQNNLAYKVIDDNVVVKRSLVNGNTGDNFDDSDYWEEIAMGGGSGSGYQMFDVVPKDHILNYDETKGLAQLGTYVYKEAIAGTRYGYPGFYAKCLEEYTDNNNTVVNIGDTYTLAGTVTDTIGVISGFTSASNYVSPDIDTTQTINELGFRFKSDLSSSGAFLSTSQAYGFNLMLGTNGSLTLYLGDGSSWITTNTGGTVQANTWYYLRVYLNSNNVTVQLSTDGTNYTTAISRQVGYVSTGYSFILGSYRGSGSPFKGGEINLNGAYFKNSNSSTIWNGPTWIVKNTNKHAFYDISQKSVFDNMYTITGEAWYYGIDTINERIFLPRSTRIKFGNTTNVGEYQPAGLPDIQGSMRIAQNGSFTGAFSDSINDSGNLFDRVGSGGWGHPGTLDFKASNSNSIYGNSTTVEYSSTKLIPYMVVGNQSEWYGMTDVVNNGMAILSEVNDGLSTRVELDGSNAQFPYITETYVNRKSGYIVYSNGYCEQWGEVTGSDIIVTFLKPFANTNYNINVGYYDYASPDDKIYAVVQWRDKTTSTVTFQAAYSGNYYNTTINWCARGYIS